MLKQIALYIFLSILVVSFAKYFHLIVVYIDHFFSYVSYYLSPIFSQTYMGILIRQVMVLSLLPLMIAGLPALGYRAVKGGKMPYFMETLWLSWLVIVLSNILVD